MKKIALIMCMSVLISCSKNETNQSIETGKTTSQPALDNQVVALVHDLKSIFPNTTPQVKDTTLIYKISPYQSIDIFINTKGEFSHLFVNQSGEQAENIAKSELLSTCKTISKQISLDLPDAIDQMEQTVNEYSNEGISAKTAISQPSYNLMLDFSRYRVASCLISKVPVTTIVKNYKEPIKPTKVTEKQAQDFGKKLYLKIVDDELFIRNAFKLRNLNDFEIFDREYQTFVNTAYGESEIQKEFGQKYYPDSKVAEPYIFCDTALGSLNSLANTMRHIVESSDSAVLRRNLREKEEEFQKAKAECSSIINMSYAQAVMEYEKKI